MNLFRNLKSDWSLVPGPLCFQQFCPLEETGFQRKIKVNFFKAYILCLKEFLAWNGCFGLFTKIEKGSGIGFWCIFSARFFHRNISYLIRYLWTKIQCHTFFSF